MRSSVRQQQQALTAQGKGSRGMPMGAWRKSRFKTLLPLVLGYAGAPSAVLKLLLQCHNMQQHSVL